MRQKYKGLPKDAWRIYKSEPIIIRVIFNDVAFIFEPRDDAPEHRKKYFVLYDPQDERIRRLSRHIYRRSFTSLLEGVDWLCDNIRWTLKQKGKLHYLYGDENIRETDQDD